MLTDGDKGPFNFIKPDILRGHVRSLARFNKSLDSATGNFQKFFFLRKA